MSTVSDYVLKEIIDSIDVPESAYEAAEQRYNDLGKWLHDASKSSCATFDPHIFAQGSFRLGTVIRPQKGEDFDLDLACKLQIGITKTTHTQKQLKQLVGVDLENYRTERNIKEGLEPKPRCWRLNYQGDPKFHMDIVPAIPEVEYRRSVLSTRMVKAGIESMLAQSVAEHAMAITDSRESGYALITDDWQVSNQTGYALWFESRMRLAEQLLKSRAASLKVAKLDALPAYRWKTPLQYGIQVLKRHRDIMFETDPEGKPVSAIITTLAARAYTGEADLEPTLRRIVDNMSLSVSKSSPRVPNPVNPEEDFADKWLRDPRLETNFSSWLDRVKTDFGTLESSNDTKVLAETMRRRFALQIDEPMLRKGLDLFGKAAAIGSGTAHTTRDGRIGTIGVPNPPHKFYG